jgi:hypothetical protein
MKWACALALASLSAAACGAPVESSALAVVEEPAASAPESSAAVTPEPAKPVSAPKPAPVRAAKPAAPAVRDITVPSGTTLMLELKTAVASDSSKVEDAVHATLTEPLRINGETVLPAGAELTGVVTEVARPGRVKGRAKVAYRFDALRANGMNYQVETSPVEHLGEATKSEDATKIGIGAGAGAVLGGLLGGGDGAAKGAAIGGAAGTGAVLATRGKDVKLEPGTSITTSLTGPLTVRIRG